jgi:hypothetical protein
VRPTWSLVRFLFLGAINNQITVIVVESLLFRGFRHWAAQRSTWLGQLVSCDLCFGTWVGFLLALVFRPHFVEVPALATPSTRLNRWGQAAAQFAGDSFAIALAGRILNEFLGLLSREVSVREEQKELLAEEVEKLAQ